MSNQATRPAEGIKSTLDLYIGHKPTFDSLCADIDALLALVQPAVSEEAERAAFEAYIRKDRGDLTTFGHGKNMHYLNGYVNNAWLGWLARAQSSAKGDEGMQHE